MKKPSVPVVIVAAMNQKTRAIGKENQLLWNIPSDLKRFKSLTLGHPVIMGRKTFESILTMLGKPLPKRTNIVITHDTNYHHEGIITAKSLEEAFKIAESENPTEIHIGGGAEIYRQALPYTSRLYLTFFYDNKEGDVFFPDFTKDFEIIKKYSTETYEGTTFEWLDYKRKE